MYGSFVLLRDAKRAEEGRRVRLDEIPGKNEAWLRDILFANPKLLPVADIDLAFGPLVPLCKELRTGAGSIDAVFINEQGRLTIVECKRWKNPQARREVVAQSLDYVAALSRWSYSDLQRQVSAATGRQGNIPFDVVSKLAGDDGIIEQEFADMTSRALREGRILILIVGDGIRQGLQSLAELVNQSATKAFSFGLVEVAIYRFNAGRYAIQPRTLARTEIITRQVTVVGSGRAVALDDYAADESELSADKPGKAHLKRWWASLLTMKFDDPDQEPPRWTGTNNLALRTPHPGIQIKAWALVDGKSTGVYVTSTNEQNATALRDFIKQEESALEEELPKGTVVDIRSAWPIVLQTATDMPDDARRAWLKRTINTFVTVLRPRLRGWLNSD